MTTFVKLPINDYYKYSLSFVGCDSGKTDFYCCTKDHPCLLGGEGDCDNDDECWEDLVCGTDNCKKWVPGAHDDIDCCRKSKSHISVFTSFVSII